MASVGRKSGPDESGGDAQPPKCKYGKQCYRRDENHFQQYLHPEGSLNKSTEECLVQKNDQPSKTKPHRTTSTSCVTPGMPLTNPYSVFFNKVEGIEECFNEACLSIKDILNSSGRKFVRSAQFTYMVDIPWLVEQYPENERSKPLLIVQGFSGKNKLPLLAEASRFDNIVLCEPKLPYPFGTHHTKMMLLLFEEGLKIVVTTANLIETDWTKKTQSIWMSPVFPPNCGSTIPFPSKDLDTNFGKDLVEYLTTYKLPSVDEWIEIINGHDLSGARVYLVASVPGRYKISNGGGGTDYGHLKLRRLLQKECSSSIVDKSWGVVCQMSSIGTLGRAPEAWLTGEFVDSLSGCDDGLSRPDYLKLVYPSVENIRHSLEGYMAGSSFPYSQRVSDSQPYLKRFLHRWKFDTRGRTPAMPHLKSYFRTSRETKDVAWYLLTSANLSKAAWGCYELKKAQFFIRSYELGVLFIPRLYNDSSTSKGVLNDFPVSLDLPLEVYGPLDKPWIYDVNYTEQADSHGRIWKIN